MPQEDKEKMPEKYEAVSFDEFESIGIVNAKDKAARFYAVIKLSVLSKGNAAEKICVLLSILMPVSSCNSKCIACCYGRFLFPISILF